MLIENRNPFFRLGGWLCGEVLVKGTQSPEFNLQHWGRGGGFISQSRDQKASIKMLIGSCMVGP